MKYSARGFTILELLITIVLLSAISFPLIFNARQSGQLQNLRTSVSVFSDDIQRTKISARDGQDKKAWGIISLSNSTYAIVSGEPDNYTSSITKRLEGGVTFDTSFQWWFELGSGQLPQEYTIHLKNQLNQQYEIVVNTAGVVSATQL